jgi:hypothetical protein
MVVACKTLDEAQASKHATALTWEKEKIITRHLAHRCPRDCDDDGCSVDVGSNPDVTLTAHLHAQATNI